MCGLIGYNGIGKPNENWLKIIAMANDSRGGDGVGYGSGNNIIKGIEHDYFFSLFQKEEFKVLSNDSIIMHSRKSSAGSISSKNNHPFAVFNETGDEKANLVGAHNGTIKNVYQLEDAYKDEPWYRNIIELGHGSTDSELLFNILNFSKDYSVLSKYIGAATIIWYHPDNPKELFVFKGGCKYGVADRPLYYLTNAKNSFCYLSSLEEPLLILSDKKTDIVEEFPTNVVVSIKNGKFTEISTIDRDVKVVETKKQMYLASRYDDFYSYNDEMSRYTNKWYKRSKLNNNKKFNKETSTVKIDSNKHISQYGTPDGNKVYLDNYLYKRNGHTLNGIYEIHKSKEIEQRIGGLEDIELWINSAATMEDCDMYVFYKGVMLYDDYSSLKFFYHQYMKPGVTNMLNIKLIHKFVNFYISEKVKSVFENKMYITDSKITLPFYDKKIVVEKGIICRLEDKLQNGVATNKKFLERYQEIVDSSQELWTKDEEIYGLVSDYEHILLSGNALQYFSDLRIYCVQGNLMSN